MKLYLNFAQTKKLADFFFDIAKGMVLGGVGSAAIAPLELKLLALLSAGLVAFICLQLGLFLLKDV